MEPKEFVGVYYEAISKRDLESVVKLFDDQATLYFPGHDEYKGKEAILAFFRDELFPQFVKIEYHDIKIVHSPDLIAAKAYVTGDVSNGNSFKRIRYTEFLEVKENQISHSEICIDMPALRAQVGKW